MEIISTAIPDVLLFKPKVFGDERGFFMETFRQSWFEEVKIDQTFVQDNHSASEKGVLRGLHYQLRQPQGKLVRVIAGEVYDVAIDLRKDSATFGQHVHSFPWSYIPYIDSNAYGGDTYLVHTIYIPYTICG